MGDLICPACKEKCTVYETSIGFKAGCPSGCFVMPTEGTWFTSEENAYKALEKICRSSG